MLTRCFSGQMLQCRFFAMTLQMCSAWRSGYGLGLCIALSTPGEQTAGPLPLEKCGSLLRCLWFSAQSGFSKTAGQQDRPFQHGLVETLDAQQGGRQRKGWLRSQKTETQGRPHRFSAGTSLWAWVSSPVRWVQWSLHSWHPGRRCLCNTVPRVHH